MAWPAAVCVALHPVIGRDIHDMIIPPVTAPVPGPYVWVQILSGIFWPTVRMSNTILSGGIPVIQRGSDIGSFVVHIGNPANINLPFIILGSASKSEFGSLSVKAENKPVATAFPSFIVGVNLTCQGPSVGPSGPFPLPMGIVIAPTTQFAGMGFGDIFASLLIMLTDMIIQAIVNKIGSKLGTAIGNMFFRTAYVMAPEVLTATLRNNTAVGNLVSLILGDWLAGSPLGYSSTDIPGTNIRTPLSGFLGDEEDAFFNALAGSSVVDSSELPQDPDRQDAGTPSNTQQSGNPTSDAGTPNPADPNSADKSSEPNQTTNQSGSNNSSSNSSSQPDKSSGDNQSSNKSDSTGDTKTTNSSNNEPNNSSQTSNSPVNNYCGDVETL